MVSVGVSDLTLLNDCGDALEVVVEVVNCRGCQMKLDFRGSARVSHRCYVINWKG